MVGTQAIVLGALINLATDEWLQTELQTELQTGANHTHVKAEKQMVRHTSCLSRRTVDH